MPSEVIIESSNSALAKALEIFRDRYVKPIEEVSTDVRPQYTFNKLAANQFIGAFNQLDVTCLAQNVTMGTFVLTLRAIEDKIVEFDLENIEGEMFPEQKQALADIFSRIHTLSNFKKQSK